MKAIVLEKHGGPEVLEHKDVPDPECGPNDVLVDVKASGVNPNEYWAREGKVKRFELPIILGSDAAGVVTEVGEHVTDVSVGDEVVAYCGIGCRTCYRCVNGEEHICERGFRIWGFDAGPMWGAHAEKVRLPAYNVVPKPRNTTWEEAASLQLTLVTAWHMLMTNAQVKANDTVLVRGSTGGVGSMAIYISKMAGAEVIATVSTEEKAKVAEEMGAHHVIIRPHTTPENLDEVSRRFITGVKEVKRMGPDVIFDSVGGDTLMESIKLLRHGGTMVTCGATSGYATDIQLAYIFIQNKRIVGSTLGTKAELIQSLRAVEAGHVKPHVSTTLPLREAAKAEELLHQRRSVGKVVLTR